MYSIYDKIDRLYSDTAKEEKPQWVDELQNELQEIKTLLQKLTKDTIKPKPKRVKDRKYYKYVQVLREKMRADVDKGIYPELNYNGKRVGINFGGLLYDKSTSEIIPRVEAFEIYDYFYEKRENLDDFIKID